MRTILRRVPVGLFAASLGLLALVSPAAGEDDPYGSTIPEPPPDGQTPSCGLSVTTGPPGTAVTATVTKVPSGQTVRILFDGQEVGRATAESDVTIAFTVPSLPPGDYLVAAVGDTFTSACGAGEGGRFEVLAATADNGGGSIPRTGIYVALLIAVAAALLLAGRALVAESGRRQRRARRSSSPRSRAGV